MTLTVVIFPKGKLVEAGKNQKLLPGLKEVGHGANIT
jgi:hypothetical protein